VKPSPRMQTYLATPSERRLTPELVALIEAARTIEAGEVHTFWPRTSKASVPAPEDGDRSLTPTTQPTCFKI
jgi:hypothetical protein